jgi:hypothetical protein
MLTMIVSACQTDPEGPDGPQTYTAEFSITESHKIPTLVKWSTDIDSGDASLLSSGSDRYQIGISLASPPNSPVNIDLYRAGIHYYRAEFNYNGSPSLKLNSSNLAPNDLAIELLRRLGENATDSEAIAEVARSLVEKDTVIKSDLVLAGKLPGLDTAKVVQEALKLLVTKNLPLKELVPSGKWILDIDTLSIHVRIRDLSLSGIILADTNKLFPPYPVRVKQPLAISGELQVGGGARAVSGIFEATNKLLTSSVKIFHDSDDATNGFDFPVNFDLLGQPSRLDLSGKLSIAAKSTTSAGAYKLEIILQDQDAFFAKASVEFVVTSAADKQGPSIEVLSPAPFTLLENATGTVLVKALVTDPSGVDSVWIDGRVAQNSGENWEVADVGIPVKDFGHTVLVVAKDKSGNQDTARIVVGRKGAPNSSAPTTLLMSPIADAILPLDSSSVLVSWKVDDPRSPIAKVFIDGVVATTSEGNIWSRRVELPATGNPTTISLLAINQAFQEITKSFQVTRRADTESNPTNDTLKPIIARQTGTKDTIVAYDVSEIAVGWSVSDASPLKVTIQGTPVAAKDEAYTATVILGTATTIVRLKATDSANNEATDSVVIRRGPEPGAPTLSREAGTTDSTVAYTVTSLELAWKILDASQVTLNGSPVQGIDGIYTIQAGPLKVGANGYKIAAKNTAGKENADSITLWRTYHDSIFPLAVAENGTKDTTAPNSSETIVLSWKVTDNDKLQSVTIGGLVATAVGEIYSANLPLKPGENVFYLVASDTAKNTTMDTVTIIRTPDVGAPVIVRETGTKDSTVSYATTAIKLSWKATDDIAIASVEINGTVVAGTAGIYSFEAKNLAIGKNGFKIVAKDAGGKSSYDTVTIVRIGDVSAPVIVREIGTKDSTVAYATTSVQLSWNVTDDIGVSSVEINDVVATGTAGIYSLEAKSLAIGENGFKIVAKDAAGKSSTDSVTITRIGDVSAPVILRGAGTKDSTVTYATTSVQLSWKVTDDIGVSSVEINGAAVTGTDGVYSLEAKNLAIGKNGFKIVAKDAEGKSSYDTVTIVRIGDVTAPVIVREIGTKDSTAVYATTSIKLSWKVTDDIGVSSVEINGAVATGTAGVYSLEAKNLAIGKNGFKIVAKDASGKSSSDSVTIVRAWKDTIAPSIVRQTGTGPKTVVYEDSIYSPAWKVTDTLLKTVNIQGILATGTAGVYSAPIKLVLGRNPITITANDQATNTASDTFSVVRSLGTIPDLSFSHAAGTHDSSFRVTIQSSIAGAVIKYTIDGTDPTTSSTAQTYSTAVLIDQTRTLKAFATALNRTPSSVGTRLYTLVLASPVPSLPSGTTADTALSVDFSCRVSGTEILYTLDGSIPTPSGSSTSRIACTSGITIDSIRTLKAVAFKDGWTSSPMVVLDYKANYRYTTWTTSTNRNVDGIDYELWNAQNTGSVSMKLTGSSTNPNGGTFEATWRGAINVLAQAGKRWGASSTITTTSVGSISLDFAATFESSDVVKMLEVYGWAYYPAGSQPTQTEAGQTASFSNHIEYFIIQDRGSYNPASGGTNAKKYGEGTIDGIVYEFWVVDRLNALMLTGSGNFKQYFSVPKSTSSHRQSGTVSVSKHFEAWENAGMKMMDCPLYEMTLKVETYSGSAVGNGSAIVTKNRLTLGDPLR